MESLAAISKRVFRTLRADCSKCFGLCCVALYFSTLEGFPTDKEAGQPCPNLLTDFKCRLHNSLRERGLKGCVAFDCFGAGQKVAQVSFGGQDWRKYPESAETMYKVFLVMRQLHELLWYLTEALTLQPARSIHGEIRKMLEETEGFTQLSPQSLLQLDISVHREGVNTLLLKTSELVRAEVRSVGEASSKHTKKLGRGLDLIGADLRRKDMRGENLRGAYLMVADLRGVDLSGADLIGADLRDANIGAADLIYSIFLTQAQVNTAKGDAETKLPYRIKCPKHWCK